MNLGQRRVDVRNKFQNLGTNDGVEIPIGEWKLRSGSMMKFDPWPVSAVRPSYCKQIYLGLRTKYEPEA